MRHQNWLAVAVAFTLLVSVRQLVGQGFAPEGRVDQSAPGLEVDKDEVLKALWQNSMEYKLNDQSFNLFGLVDGYRDFENAEWRTPEVKSAQRQAAGLCDLFTIGLNLYTEGGLTPKDKVKALQDAFIAGLLKGENKDAEVFGLAVGIAINQRIGAQVLREAKARHVRVWERMIPLCEAIAGTAGTGAPVEFAVEFRRGETDCHFIAKNTSSNDLSNVTVFVNPTFGDIDRSTQKQYVFVASFKKNDVIEFPNIVPHPSAYNYRNKTKGALTYSLYSDELRVTSRGLSLTGWARVGARSVVYKSTFVNK